MPKLPPSWFRRQSTLQRTMLRNTARGTTSLVAPQPRPLDPLGTAAVNGSSGGVDQAGMIFANGTGQVITNGVDTLVTCLTLDSTDGTGDVTALTSAGLTLDLVNGRIQITDPAAAGTYHVGAQVRWPSNGTGWRRMFIERNDPIGGSTIDVAQDLRSAVTGEITFQGCSGVVNAAVEDVFRLYVHQSSGGDLTVGEFAQDMFLWCFRIGAFGGPSASA